MRRILYPLSMTLLAGTLLVACLEKPADGSDAGQNNNNGVNQDAAVDAEVTPDATVSCQPDDLVSQFTCGSGRKCTLIDQENHVGCAPTGFTSVYAACTDTRTGCTYPDRCPDECALSTLCSNADDPARFICLPFCEELNSACMNGKCTHVINLAGGGTAYLCAPADGCDPVSFTGCDPGQHCYLDHIGGGLTFCVDDPGILTEGQTCTDDYACVPGLTCFGPQGSGTCRPLCHAGNDAECDPGVTCTQIPNTDYGLCFN
jgi:hypothetical protein